MYYGNEIIAIFGGIGAKPPKDIRNKSRDIERQNPDNNDPFKVVLDGSKKIKNAVENWQQTDRGIWYTALDSGKVKVRRLLGSEIDTTVADYDMLNWLRIPGQDKK